MIKTIIFDFGAVIIPLNEQLTRDAFKKVGAKPTLWEDKESLKAYEVGKISTQVFLKKVQAHCFRKVFLGDLAKAWNAMLLALPEENVKFLKSLKKDYKLILLSNTNELHIEAIKDQSGPFLYNLLIKQFDKVYYSYEMGMRKPDAEIFEKVLKDNKLKAEETFYIDDGLKNVNSAKELGIHTWHFKPGEDSIFDLDKALSKHR